MTLLSHGDRHGSTPLTMTIWIEIGLMTQSSHPERSRRMSNVKRRNEKGLGIYFKVF